MHLEEQIIIKCQEAVMEACFLLLMTKVSTFFETVTKVLRSILLILLKHTA